MEDEDITFQQNSQPFFTEKEWETDLIKPCSSAKDNSRKRKNIQTEPLPVGQHSPSKSINMQQSNKVDNNDALSPPEKQNNNKCQQCNHLGNPLDKRNFHFGNLVTYELELLPPCLRSEAYIYILRYIDMLKRNHQPKNDHN